MKTVSKQGSGLIATLFLAGTLVLLLLLYVTSGHRQRCCNESADHFSLIKLI